MSCFGDAGNVQLVILLKGSQPPILISMRQLTSLGRNVRTFQHTEDEINTEGMLACGCVDCLYVCRRFMSRFPFTFIVFRGSFGCLVPSSSLMSNRANFNVRERNTRHQHRFGARLLLPNKSRIGSIVLWFVITFPAAGGARGLFLLHC